MEDWSELVLFSIYYEGQKWTPEPLPGLDWCNWRIDASCVALNETSDFKARMDRIIYELDDIKTERYESERFLSGLVLFNGPPTVFEKVLGNTLYSAVAKQFEEHFTNFSSPDWSDWSDYSLKTYVNANKHIVDKMNERLLLNLITLNI